MDVFTQLILNSIIAGAVYVLITLGFNLAYGATKFINFAHGAVGMVSAYAVFGLARLAEWNLLISVLLGVVGAVVLGCAIDFFIYRPLRRRRASPLVIFIGSLGVFTVIQATISILFGTQFQTLEPIPSMARVYQIWGGHISGTQILTLILALVCFVGLAFVIKYTKLGRAVRAVSDDEEVAKIMGIRTDSVIAVTFGIGSALVGLGTIMRGFDTGIYPGMGLLLLLEAAVPAIVGGIGNIYGGAIGALLLALVENFGIWKIESEWKVVIYYLVLVIFLLFRPRGIFKK